VPGKKYDQKINVPNNSAHTVIRVTDSYYCSRFFSLMFFFFCNVKQQQVIYIHSIFTYFETTAHKLRIKRLLSFVVVDANIVIVYHSWCERAFTPCIVAKSAWWWTRRWVNRLLVLPSFVFTVDQQVLQTG